MSNTKPDAVKIPDYRLTTDIAQRAGVIERAALFMGERLPLDKVWLLEFREESERRRKIQGDLLWVFHRYWAAHNNFSVKWAHASVKHDILLPLKLSAKSKRVREQAQFEKQILDYIPDYNTRIKAAYQVINSRGQPLSLFANFITEYQAMGAKEGCLLESNNQPEYDEAIYGKRAA